MPEPADLHGRLVMGRAIILSNPCFPSSFAASARAHRVADPDWEIKVLLRVSDALERCGEHEDAASLQVRALQLMVGEPTGEMRLDAAVAGASHRQ